MSEVDRLGREPIEVLTLHQDFCSLTWGEFPCLAGGTDNLIIQSGNITAATWSTTSTLITQGHPDAFGENNAILYESDGDVAWELAQQNEADVSVDDFAGSIYVKNNTAIDTFALGIQIQGTTDPEGTNPVNTGLIDVDYNIATETSSTGESLIKDHGLISLSGGWYRLWFETNPVSGVIGTAIYNVAVALQLDLGENRPAGESAFVFAPQVSRGSLQEYTETGEAPRIVKSGEARPCFNTRFTCQAIESYTLGEPLLLNFASPQRNIPRDDYYIPMLTAAKTTAAKINPGGADGNSKALGVRATLSATFQDAPHTDRLVDKYTAQRDYDPFERSTFWAKWRARNPYYMHRRLDLKSGYMKDGVIEPESMTTRTFFITGFSGPNASGQVTIKGEDVLTLAQNSKAQAPKASPGKLLNDINETATTLELAPPEGGGAWSTSEYPMSGFLRINDEVVSYTRQSSGANVFDIVRAQRATDAETHDADDTAQWCLVYTSETPPDILYDLLNTYAGIDAVYLDKTQWDAEFSTYMGTLYSTFISEPVGISTLVSEMCEQMYFVIWWDERQSKVFIRAIRSAFDDQVFDLNDNQNLLADSISWTDLPDQLITQVWVYYGQRNPVRKLDETDNYRAVRIITDADAESPERNGIQKIKAIYSRWIDAGNGGAADELGEAILRRYANIPRECKFSVDAKDGAIWLSDFIQITNRLRVDQFGVPELANLQVYEAREAQQGSVFEYSAQEFLLPDEPEDPNDIEILIDADYANINLRSFYEERRSPPTGVETITFRITSGVTIGGYAVGTPNMPDPFTSADDLYYSGGVSYIDATASPSYTETINFGQIPVLQRQGIGSMRTIARGSTYTDVDDGPIGETDVEVREYPVSHAIETGDWPVGTVIRLVVEAGARVIGEGGNGSCHATTDTIDELFGGDIKYYNAVKGGDGGHALKVEYDIEIDNRGTIAAGGGGGGTARVVFVSTNLVTNTSAHGGGGAGYAISDVKNCLENGSWSVRTQPTVGDFLVGGNRGLVRFDADNFGRGGNGGDAATDGDRGLAEVTDFGRGMGFGGKAGYAISEGADMITWANKGDVRGAEFN